ncbi:hypothetical protein [Mesorhizobium sp. 1M-11]|uniref:hypothetical protein n=1 Tax=Mesorhizobium sp. 1M-11 TaxID=1529006 RepID=UPI0006C7390A|nr:hypothetical protein [Mesorhizobium sp. 1M-11]
MNIATIISAKQATPSSDVDLHEMAAMDFQPWNPRVGLTQQGIYDHARRNLETACLALGVMYKTKEDLAAMMGANPELFQDLLEAISDSKKGFEEIATICGAAEARLLVVGAGAALKEVAAA